LRALYLRARVVNVLEREMELVLVMFGRAAVLGAAIGEHAAERNAVLLEERQHAVVEQISRRERRLRVVELHHGDLRVRVDEGLLVDAADTLESADVKRVLRAAIARAFALELAVCLLVELRLLERRDLRLREHQPPPAPSWPRALAAASSQPRD